MISMVPFEPNMAKSAYERENLTKTTSINLEVSGKPFQKKTTGTTGQITNQRNGNQRESVQH